MKNQLNRGVKLFITLIVWVVLFKVVSEVITNGFLRLIVQVGLVYGIFKFNIQGAKSQANNRNNYRR